MRFSDYIIYVDESGDHNLRSPDASYPVFVLVFCIFSKADYANLVAPAVQRFKFKHFGHDIVLLHERGIRKAKKPFQFLMDKNLRAAFMDDLNKLVEQSPFTAVSIVIRKDLLGDSTCDRTILTT